MKLLELKNLSNILRWCLEFTFVIGLLIIIFLNLILKNIFGYNFSGEWGERYYYTSLTVLTLSGLSALIIIRQVIEIFKSVQKDTPFIYKNVRCFYISSVCCFIIALLFGVQMFLYPTVLTFAVGYIFLVLCLACLVFGKLFHKAVNYKEENDLTI